MKSETYVSVNQKDKLDLSSINKAQYAEKHDVKFNLNFKINAHVC